MIRSVMVGEGLIPKTRTLLAVVSAPNAFVNPMSAALPAAPPDIAWPAGSAGHPDDVHNGAGLPVFHPRPIEFAKMDDTEDLEIPSRPPTLHTKILKTAARNGSRIVHQNVNVRICRERAFTFAVR